MKYSILKRLAAAALSLSFVAAPVLADIIAIRGATVHTAGPAGSIDNATVVIDDGKISAVGQGISIPASARVIDATGKHVAPGFMHSASTLALSELGREQRFSDGNGKDSEFDAAFDVKYAINYQSQVVAENRRQGLTRAVSNPGGSGKMFFGTGAVIALNNTMDMIVTSGPMIANLTANGNRNIGWAHVRMVFDEVLHYQKNRRSVMRGNGRNDYFLKPINMDALIPVLSGDKALALTTHGGNDILQAIQLKQDYGLDLIIMGAEEGWKVADQIRESGVPLIIDPQKNLPNGADTLGATFSNAAKLEQAGVTYAVAGSGMLSGNSAYLVGQLAGMSVAHGVSWQGALKSITINPAKIFGIDDSYGSIEVGKDGDVVVWDGDPLDVTSNTQHVLVRGVEYPLVSRRSRLSQRYLNKADPKPYGLR